MHQDRLLPKQDPERWQRPNVQNLGCGQFQETVDHIASGCPELTKAEYIQRHNKAAAITSKNKMNTTNMNQLL